MVAKSVASILAEHESEFGQLNLSAEQRAHLLFYCNGFRTDDHGKENFVIWVCQACLILDENRSTDLHTRLVNSPEASSNSTGSSTIKSTDAILNFDDEFVIESVPPQVNNRNDNVSQR